MPKYVPRSAAGRGIPFRARAPAAYPPRAEPTPLSERMRIPFLVLLLCLAPGCALTRTTENAPLPAEALAALQPGTTTAREVVERLGAPSEVVQLGKRSAYRYQFSQSKRTVLFLLVVALQNEDARADRVWVFFDESQVLTHVGTTLDGDEPEYAMPWEELHE